MSIISKLSKLVEVRTTDPEDIRQQRLLNALLVILVTITVVQELIILAIIVFDLPIHPPLAEARFRTQSYVGSVASIVLCVLIFIVNRYWSATLARLFFLLGLAALVFSNTPDNWTLATLTYALSIPIVIGSFLLGPRAGFVLAGVSSLATTVVGVLLHVGIYVTPIFNLFAISALAWFTAHTLQRALADLRALNVELDQRVQDRTRDLAESLAKNQAILDSTADGVIVFDNVGRAVVANPAMSEMLGRPLEAITGRDIETLMGDEVSVEDRETVSHLLQDIHQAHSGVKFRWGNRTFSISLAPVHDNFNRVTGTVAVFRDFTKEAEVDRMKSTFVSIASHELRTPLNAIMGYAEMLQQNVYGPLTDRQNGALARMVANTGHMLSLVNNLLDRARMEAGTLTLNFSSFSPSQLVAGVRGVMDVMAQNKGLALTSHIADDVPATLVGDWQRLQQILINLVNNAIKFTQEGSVDIRIYLVDDSRWAMEVSDTGCGIPAEAQSYIFEPFRQVDDSATREYGGAGLGLSIVKQLITLMEGEIKLTSEVGKGSTFTVVLPLVPTQGGEQADAAEGQPAWPSARKTAAPAS